MTSTAEGKKNARSGNPAKKATAKKTASASEFKKRALGVEIQLPESELWVRAKRVELQTFIRQGTVPNPLMEIIGEALERGSKADIPKMMGAEDGKVDLDMVNQMYEIVNTLVCASMVEPRVHPVPTEDDVTQYNAEHANDEGFEPVENPEDLRDDELLYVDEIGDMDKMFLFQWNTGGTSDLATFRREFGADMDALAEMQGSGGKTE